MSILKIPGRAIRDNTVTSAKISSIDFDTSNIQEGDNLFFTNARVYANVAQIGYATTGYVDTSISNLVDSAPGALDTLNELAASLNDDANFAATTVNLIGNAFAQANTAISTAQSAFDEANTKIDIVKLEYNVKEYGAVGDGSDATYAIQQAVSAANSTGGTVYFPRGTYVANTMITLQSNTRILGDGIGATIIKAAGTLNPNTDIFINTEYADDSNVNYNIHFQDFTIDGNNNADRYAGMLTMIKVINGSYRNVEVKNSSYIGMRVGGCQNVVVTGCRFENIGRDIPSTLSAPALWVAKVYDAYECTNIIVDKNHFLNNKWSGSYFMPQSGAFTNNILYNNGESGVFSNQDARNIRYVGNYIRKQSKSNISASGLEIGGWKHVVANNIITECDADGISITDSRDTVIVGNLCFDNGEDAANTASFANAGGIALISLDANGCNNLTITSNRLYGQPYGISIYKGASGLPIANSIITNNQLQNNDNAEFVNLNSNSLDSSTILKPTLDDLDTVSTSNASFTSSVFFPSGSVSSPSISFTGDTNTGIYRIGANQIGIASDGTNRANVYDKGVVITSLQEKRVAMPASEIDLSQGNYFTKTISGTTTLTVANVPATNNGISFLLELVSGGSYTVNYFSGITWGGGAPPTLSANTDVLGFFTYDGGTTWRGMLVSGDTR